MKNNYRWDVFISYSHSISNFVNSELIEPLIDVDLNVYWDRHKEFPITGRLIDNIVQAIKLSKKIIIVLSKEYVEGKSGWCEFESALAVTEEISHKEKNRLIVLSKENCTIPPELTSVIRTDVSNGIHESFIKKISKEVTKQTSSAFQMSTRGSILAVGSHWDDLLIGCLGTLLKLKKYYNYEVAILVLCNTYTTYYGSHQNGLSEIASDIYHKLCKKCGFENLNESETVKDIIQGVQLSDRSLRDQSSTIKTVLRQIAKEHNDDGKTYNIIFSPPVDDRNDDHAIAGEVIFSTFRSPSHSILEYNIKRYTVWPFSVNICISIDEEIADEKSKVITEVCKIPNKVKNSSRLFNKDIIGAFLQVNAIDFAKNPNTKYAEIFRGRIEL